MRPRLEEKHLFNEHRLPDNVEKLLYLLLYTPIGIIFFCIRVISGLIALLLASALPDVASLRSAVKYILSFSLGILVRTEKPENRDDTVKILISNHVSGLDYLALHLAADSYSPTKYRMQEVLENALGLYYVSGEVNTDVAANKVIAIFPEVITTNGKGLLKFKGKMFEKIFQHQIKIQPVTIQAWRPPIADLAIKSLGSQWWSDLMLYLFVPCTLYTITFLPVMTRSETATDENLLAEEIREVIANDLKIPRTQFTSNDLNAFEKRYMFERQRSLDSRANLVSNTLARDPQLEVMARQVKEVLPLVPQHVIIQDLMKTRNIDYTISNILDGNVRYTPETVTQQPTPSASTSVPTTAQPKGFPRNANERMMTFKERKRELIDNARKKYIEKNGLNIALNNC